MSKLNITLYNNVINNTVDGAVLDTNAIKTWRENVKAVVDGNDDLFNSHKNANVTDTNGIHGLKIESGTFTPTVAGTSVTGNNTYSLQDGKYFLIGKLCYFSIRITLTAKDAAMSGNALINGLPFATKNDVDRRSAVVLGSLQNFTLVPATPHIRAFMGSSSSSVTLWQDGDNVNGSFVASGTSITSKTIIILSGQYEIG